MEGAVPPVLDGLVEDPPLVIVREALVAVRFTLLAGRAPRPNAVRTVASHPHAHRADPRVDRHRTCPTPQVRVTHVDLGGGGPGRPR